MSSTRCSRFQAAPSCNTSGSGWVYPEQRRCGCRTKLAGDGARVWRDMIMETKGAGHGTHDQRPGHRRGALLPPQSIAGNYTGWFSHRRKPRYCTAPNDLIDGATPYRQQLRRGAPGSMASCFRPSMSKIALQHACFVLDLWSACTT